MNQVDSIALTATAAAAAAASVGFVFCRILRIRNVVAASQVLLALH